MVNTKNLRDAVKKSADKLAKSASKNVDAVKKQPLENIPIQKI